jgi:hypothetical protein
VKRRRRRHTHAKPAQLAPRSPARGFNSPIDTGKDDARIFQQSAASIGELHPARLSAEELYTEFELNGLDLLAEWRLLHAKSFRRPGDVAFLGDGHEVAKVSQLNCHMGRI